MPASTPIAVIGAGPYGLSIAAHLEARGVDYRIFGTPMRSWLEHMPERMFLKSVGFASSLSDPDRRHTLGAFCRQEGREYADGAAWPVPIGTFTDYTLWFQRTVVPNVEQDDVVSLDRRGDDFELRLASDQRVTARRVVLAVGHLYFAHVPASLAVLPAELASHAMAHRDFSRFRGHDVTVIGAGQSALESAALLHESGASVRVLVRGRKVAWNPDPVPGPRSGWARVRAPQSGLGDGWPGYLYCNGPRAFSYLPYAARARVVATALGPAGAWWLKPRVVGRFPVETATSIRTAEPDGSRARLRVATADRRERELLTDHILAGTGYRVDIDALPFVSQGLAAGVRRAGRSPLLSTNFESSVPGLYFVGLAAAATFGPVLRFVYGADFTARRVTAHLIDGQWRRPRPRRAKRAPATLVR